MNDSTIAKQVIKALEDGNFYAECPCCEDQVPLRRCGLFFDDDFTDRALEVYREYVAEMDERIAEVNGRTKHISRSSELRAQAVNLGFILERLAPVLNTFAFQCNDCRSIFDPIDYVIFEGLCTKGEVSKILFADVKTGQSRLSAKQREIRNLVLGKKVHFETYEVL